MIAIKDMDMPKSCLECPLSYANGWEVVHLHCILSVWGVDNIDWEHKRHKDCPLVEVIEDERRQRNGITVRR